jgi:hypothetical protein
MIADAARGRFLLAALLLIHPRLPSLAFSAMKRHTLAFLGLFLGSSLGGAADAPQGKLPPATSRPIDFARDIQPIFARACVTCHGPEKQRGGVRLDDGVAALKGGNSGAILKSGDAPGSRLLVVVAGLDPEMKMPPAGKPGLSTDEVGHLRAWIEQGAKWPAAGTTTTGPVKSSHWAFQPIREQALPALTQTALPALTQPGSPVRNGIDRFVLARLEKEKIAPAPEADRVTLIRRLSLDLLGLPPSPAEVDAFLADSSPEAYERLVDRLLASPHYGERWGRHWLDAARYADSDGYEKDTGRPFAWRWRNWVIDALNRDLPFDQFAVEQLAGDLLAGATTEQKIATGFHRNTLTNREGGVDQEQYRVEAVIDRVNTTSKVFLGLTLGCCQCHDHKYDPFSQREYYEFFAFFNSDQEVNIPAPLPGEEPIVAAMKAAHAKKAKELERALDEYKGKSAAETMKKWEAALKPEAKKALPSAVQTVLAVEPKNRTVEQVKALADYYATVDPKRAELAKALADHQKNAPTGTLAQTLMLIKTPRPTYIHLRGDFLRKGAQVQPGTPGVLPVLTPPTLPALTQPGSPAAGSPTRLDLARWIVAPENPLTRRVLVNWVWQKYFGVGLVKTLEDFGTQGEKPSHPELLDWLAGEVSRQGWSLKALHRLIVTSATYRQSSRYRPELHDRDPYNVLLARQSRVRLEAEILRDVNLAASGLLTPTIGGLSIRPPQPPGISELTYAGSAKWVESTGPDRYRRGLYIWFQRTSPYPMLMTFDAPDSNVCVVRREKSNTPLQALTLLNDVVFVECARALGKRILTEQPGPVSERIRHGFRLCLGREPSATELSRLTRLFEELHSLAKAKPEEAAKLAGKARPANVDAAEAAAWVALARTLLNLDEFVTRE